MFVVVSRDINQSAVIALFHGCSSCDEKDRAITRRCSTHVQPPAVVLPTASNCFSITVPQVRLRLRRATDCGDAARAETLEATTCSSSSRYSSAPMDEEEMAYRESLPL